MASSKAKHSLQHRQTKTNYSMLPQTTQSLQSNPGAKISVWMEPQYAMLKESSVTDKTRAITIRVSTQMLSEIDSRIPGHRKNKREQFILDSLESYLRHREPPQKVTKAISRSTGEIKTGRYEP